jgi:hypothetical protein
MRESELKYPREALYDWWQARNGGTPPKKDDIRLLEHLIDTLFFASLGKEEGQPALVRVVYQERGIEGLAAEREHADYDSSEDPALAWAIIPFIPMPLTVKALVKLTPAANVERTAVVVGPHDGELCIQGLARRVKHTDGGAVLVFSAPEPGFISMGWATGRRGQSWRLLNAAYTATFSGSVAKSA